MGGRRDAAAWRRPGGAGQAQATLPRGRQAARAPRASPLPPSPISQVLQRGEGAPALPGIWQAAGGALADQLQGGEGGEAGGPLRRQQLRRRAGGEGLGWSHHSATGPGLPGDRCRGGQGGRQGATRGDALPEAQTRAQPSHKPCAASAGTVHCHTVPCRITQCRAVPYNTRLGAVPLVIAPAGPTSAPINVLGALQAGVRRCVYTCASASRVGRAGLRAQRGHDLPSGLSKASPTSRPASQQGRKLTEESTHPRAPHPPTHLHESQALQLAKAACPGCRQRRRHRQVEAQLAQRVQHAWRSAPAGRQRQRPLRAVQQDAQHAQRRQRTRRCGRQRRQQIPQLHTLYVGRRRVGVPRQESSGGTSAVGNCQWSAASWRCEGASSRLASRSCWLATVAGWRRVHRPCSQAPASLAEPRERACRKPGRRDVRHRLDVQQLPRGVKGRVSFSDQRVSPPEGVAPISGRAGGQEQGKVSGTNGRAGRYQRPDPAGVSCPPLRHGTVCPGRCVSQSPLAYVAQSQYLQYLQPLHPRKLRQQEVGGRALGVGGEALCRRSADVGPGAARNTGAGGNDPQQHPAQRGQAVDHHTMLSGQAVHSGGMQPKGATSRCGSGGQSMHCFRQSARSVRYQGCARVSARLPRRPARLTCSLPARLRHTPRTAGRKAGVGRAGMRWGGWVGVVGGVGVGGVGGREWRVGVNRPQAHGTTGAAAIHWSSMVHAPRLAASIHLPACPPARPPARLRSSS